MSCPDLETPPPNLWQLEDRLRNEQDILTTDIHLTLQRCFQLSTAPKGSVITEAMEKCELSEQDLEEIKDAAVRGIIDIGGSIPGVSREQASQEQAEYTHIIGRAGLMLEELATK